MSDGLSGRSVEVGVGVEGVGAGIAGWFEFGRLAGLVDRSDLVDLIDQSGPVDLASLVGLVD